MNQNTGCFEVKGSYTGVPGKERGGFISPSNVQRASYYGIGTRHVLLTKWIKEWMEKNLAFIYLRLNNLPFPKNRIWQSDTMFSIQTTGEADKKQESKINQITRNTFSKRTDCFTIFKWTQLLEEPA